MGQMDVWGIIVPLTASGMRRGLPRGCASVDLVVLQAGNAGHAEVGGSSRGGVDMSGRSRRERGYG